MSNDELKFYIQKMIESRGIPNALRIIRSESHDEVYRATFHVTGSNFSERVYCILNGIYDTCMCRNCHTVPVRFIDMKRGYRKFCCSRCAALDMHGEHMSTGEIIHE